MKYPQVTEWSLQRHREGLQERRASVGADSHDAIDRLTRTIDAVLDHPDGLRPEEVGFGVTSLDRVPPLELPAFLNQQTLGVGWDGAPVVVMGTEPAERVDVPEDVAWHAIYSVLVAAESRPEILDRIVAGSSWMASTKGASSSTDKRPYHLQANDFIHVERRGGSPTWKVVAQVVAPGSADRWPELLATRMNKPGLGDYAYQIDRSAVPAMTSDKGAPPSDVRVSFLTDVLQLLRQDARVLLLHGFGGPGRWPDWWAQDQRLIGAFLDLDPNDVELDWRYVPPSGAASCVASRRLLPKSAT
ncbi:MAG: hypothetical protein ACYDB4_19850 [Candidatus Dormibacteraceae bacterium]